MPEQPVKKHLRCRDPDGAEEFRREIVKVPRQHNVGTGNSGWSGAWHDDLKAHPRTRNEHVRRVRGDCSTRNICRTAEGR